MKYPLLEPQINAFYAFINAYVLPFLSYKKRREFTADEILFREIEEFVQIVDSDVVCTCEIDDMLELCLLSNGEVLVNGDCPLSNYCFFDIPPLIKSGEFPSIAVMRDGTHYEYLYRIALNDLSKSAVIESLNSYLADPAGNTWSLPYLQSADSRQLELV